MTTESRHTFRWRKRALAIVAVPVTMLLCLGAVTLALDQLCYTGLTQRLPLYPGATVVVERHSGLRAFGSGETVMVLETSDPIETVRDWYGRNAGGAVRRMQQQGQGMLITLTSATYSVYPLEDAQGTQVVLNGVCGG